MPFTKDCKSEEGCRIHWPEQYDQNQIYVLH